MKPQLRSLIKENIRQAKIYLAKGELSPEGLKTLIQIDPSTQKKYVGWMAKVLINEEPDMDDLRNTIEEFHVFLEKGKTKSKDINSYKSFSDLKSEVEELNNTGGGLSLKDLESEYEVIMDTPDLLIMTPHTHEASRKLGLTYFSYRDCGDGTDSAWCTTYKTPNHFNSYYHQHNVTFYYVKVRSKQIMNQIQQRFPDRWKPLVVTALCVLDDGRIDAYDGNDKQLKSNEVQDLIKILGIS